MKKRISLTHILFLLIFSFPNLYGGSDFSGFFDIYNTIGINGNSGLLNSRVEIKTDLLFPIRGNSLFISTKFTKHNIVNPKFDPRLKEIYFSFSLGENLELRAGRQIFSWGNTERVRISDIISPLDYREFITMDYNEMKMGVDSLQLTYYHKDLKFDLILVPFFRGSLFPSENDSWFNIITNREIYGSHVGYLIKKPVTKLINSQLFGKLTFFLKGFDISVFGFSKWSDTPSPTLVKSEKVNDLDLGFERLHGAGLYFSKPVDFMVLRGEFILYVNRLVQSKSGSEIFFKRDYKEWMFGADIFLRNEMKISVQMLYNSVPGREGVPTDKNSYLGNLNIEGKLIGNSIRFRNFCYISLDEKGIYNRTEILFPLDDSFQPSLGIDIFGGERSFFGRYLNNSQIWLKLKYIF